MGRTEGDYLKAFEQLIVAAEDFSDPRARRFREAVSELCRTADIRYIRLEMHTGSGAGRLRSTRQLFPEEGESVYTDDCVCEEEHFQYDDLEIAVRACMPPGSPALDPDNPLQAEAVLKMVALRTHHQYLHEHRTYLHRMDQQTGVFNQTYALSWLSDLIDAGKADSYAGCSFNIRGMSVINNRFGTEHGTRIMQEYVTKLQGLLGKEGIVARIASDRFLSFFPRTMMQDVIRYLEGHELTGIREIPSPVTVSAWAGFDLIHNRETPMEVADRMNAALRTAKYDSNMTYVFYDEKIEQKINLNKHIESLFKHALRDEEFKVFYQPKVDLKRYRIAGAEALCRWRHDGRIILPYQFIPVLENSGDICTLDFYMIESVCRDLRRWLDAGRNAVRVSVNLSRCHMGDPLLLDRILEIIDRYRIPHRCLEIELTETTSDMGFEEMQKLVRGLRNAGISCSVDDFGVGYSSMNVLREMPWSTIKIDRSFMPSGSGDLEDEKKKTMLKSVITMAHSLGLSSIAEGVETIEQIILLKAYGCFMGQGFFFDRPMTAEEFEKKLV